MSSFASLTILALEKPKDGLKVVAQFNPKEQQIDSQIPWQPTKHKGAGPYDLEYTGAQPDAMSFELLFDGFEQNASVIPQITALKEMTLPMEPKGKNARPTIVAVLWGKATFRAVIESISVKYTMYSPEGEVLRATANVKLKQVREASVGKARA